MYDWVHVHSSLPPLFLLVDYCFKPAHSHTLHIKRHRLVFIFWIVHGWISHDFLVYLITVCFGLIDDE